MCGAPATAAAYERATVEGRPGIYLYWSQRTITYHIHQRASADVPLAEAVGAIRRSFFAWAAPSCTDLDFDFGGLSNTRATNRVVADDAADRQNTIVWREEQGELASDSGAPLDESVAALTTLVYDVQTGEIIDADMDLNGHHFFWSTTDDKAKAATDIQNVVTHEAGHILGLAHSTVRDSTMYAEMDQAELSKRDLHQDDLDALCKLYPFGAPTPIGADQPPPRMGVQGAAGCSAHGAAYRSGPELALLVLLALAHCSFRSVCRRARAATSSPPGRRAERAL